MFTYFLVPIRRLITWSRAKQKQTASNPPGVLLHQCDQLPLDKFITALITGDYSVLVVSGQFTKAQLQTAWDNIYYEYLQISWRPAGTEYFIKLQSDEALLRDEVLTIELAIYYLSPALAPYANAYYPRIIEGLKRYGYKITQPADGNYTQQLKVLNNKLIPKRLRLKVLQQQIDDYYNKNIKAEKPSAENFYSVLRKLSRYMGYAIRVTDITVAEYAGLLNDYMRELETQNANKQKL